MAFLQRLMTVQLTTGVGGVPGQIKTFSESGTNQVTISDLRMSADILRAGVPQYDQLSMMIWGLRLSTMNDIATIGVELQVVSRGSVVVSAGDTNTTPAVVFAGTIIEALPSFENLPDVPLRITARGGLDLGVISAKPKSFSGGADVATVMSGIANEMGKRFDNHGVTGVLHNPYLDGTLLQQAEKVKRDVGFEMTVESDALVIWPKNGSRTQQSIPLISPDTGMIGYPQYSIWGVNVRTIFNPNIQLGGKIQVQSMLDPANGTWNVFRLSHRLDSLVPKGNWFTIVETVREGITPPLPAPQ